MLGDGFNTLPGTMVSPIREFQNTYYRVIHIIRFTITSQLIAFSKRNNMAIFTASYMHIHTHAHRGFQKKKEPINFPVVSQAEKGESPTKIAQTTGETISPLHFFSVNTF